MRRLILLVFIGMFLAGCAGTAKEAEYCAHSTMYKNWDHLKFSWWGYKEPSEETYRKTEEQGWWGIPIPYTPEK